MCRYMQMATWFVLFIASAAQAQVISNSPNLPPLNGQYINFPPVPVIYNTGFGSLLVNSISHRDFLSNTPPPLNVGGNTVDSFLSTVYGVGEAYNGPNGTGTLLGAFPINASGTPVTVSVTKVSGTNGQPTGTFDTEMLQLDLSSTSPFGPYLIRESPTLPSTGQTTITDVGGGNFQIDSFFDIFTELSLDGGQTWIPSSGQPEHVVLNSVPEPGSIGLCCVAGLVGVYLYYHKVKRAATKPFAR